MDHFGRGRNANSFALFVSVVFLGLFSFRVPAHAVEGPATVPLDGGPLGMLDFSAGADGYFYAQSGTSSNSNTTVRLKAEQIQLLIFYVALGIVGAGQKCSPYRQLFEYCDRKDLHQSVERCLDVQSFADDGDQNIHRHRDPDLRLHRVFRRAIEPLDPQVLFDPLEEKLHLPTARVEVANRWRRQGGLIGEEHQRFASLGVPETDAPRMVSTPTFILAVDDFRLVRMQRQSALSKPLFKRNPH